MARINENYLKLQAGYLFPEIGRRVSAFCEANPQADVIKMGIGDVTRPLVPAVIEAMHKGVDEMANADTFRGYGPEQGYDFLRDAIAKNDFQDRGIDISAEEIFVSDGSKCDSGNILDIFGNDNRIAVLDPVYPVYVDTNVMAGHTGPADENGRYEGLIYMPVTADSNFEPQLPDEPVDLIYLCYPNNPTGVVATKAMLKSGSTTPTLTARSLCTMPPTKHLSLKLMCRVRFSKSKGHVIVPSSSVASAKQQASPVSDVR